MHKNQSCCLINIKGLITLLVLLSFTSVVRPQVYSWRDSSGQLHFGDKPPESQSALEVKNITIIEKNPTGNVDQAVQRRKARQADLLHEMEQASKKREENKEKRRQMKKEKGIKCQRAKNRVKHNERYSLIFREDDNGERIYLNDEQRKAYDKSLKDEMVKYCK